MRKTSIVAAIKTELDRAGRGSHAELARRMGVHPPQVHDLLAGRAHVKTAQAALDQLGISVTGPERPSITVSSQPTKAQVAAGTARKN